MRILDYIVSIIIISTLGMLYKKYQRKYGLDEELNGNNLVNKYVLLIYHYLLTNIWNY